MLITSHLLAQIEDVCDRVAILDRGKLIVEGSVLDLVGQRDRQALIVDPLPATDLEDLKVWLAARGSLAQCGRATEGAIGSIIFEQGVPGQGVRVPHRKGWVRTKCLTTRSPNLTGSPVHHLPISPPFNQYFSMSAASVPFSFSPLGPNSG